MCLPVTLASSISALKPNSIHSYAKSSLLHLKVRVRNKNLKTYPS